MSMTSALPHPFLNEQQSMACIHCGLCLGSCPTYLETGNENDSPRGRIHLMRALQDGRMELAAEPVRHLDLCLGCRACETACPSGVAYGALLEQARHHVERNHDRSFWDHWLRRAFIEGVFPHPERLEIAITPARWIQEAGLEKWMPSRVKDMLDLLPHELSVDWLPLSSFTRAAERRGVAGLLSGCVMSVLFESTHQNTLKVLNAAGWDVVVPAAQGCCGALHAHGGGMDTARDLARKTIQVFEEAHVDFVVVNAAGCGSTVKEYGAMLAEDPVWRDRAAKFSLKVKDFSELVDPGLFPENAWLGGTVTYQDACHLAHAQRITAGPRRLVQRVSGKAYVELPEADLCCGSAGSYNLTEPEMAARLQNRKCNHVLATGATTVVTCNPGCQLQIQAGLGKQDRTDVRVIHLADFLAGCLR